MRLAILPAAVMAVLSAALVAFVLLAQEGAADAVTFGVLAGGGVLGCSVLVGATLAARAEARRMSRWYEPLRRTVAAGQSELQELLQRLERGERVELTPFSHHAPPQADALGQLAYEISLSQWRARAAVVQAAQLAKTGSPDSEEKVEVFVNLARRLQSLVHREINMLDQLENEVEDPELLKGLFHVDHLATRIRRHAENVAVLGGSVSRRQWTRPVSLTEVLRSSIAEVEHYSRVKLVPPIEGTLRGHAVADVIHLLSELVENATTFSDPHTQVLLRAQRVTAGLAVEVEDRGLGMPLEEQARINTLLANPERIDISKLLADGRIGMYVVSALARRHAIAVRLQSNIYGGVQAVLVLPHPLIGDESVETPHQAATGTPRHAPAASEQRPAVQAAPPARPVAPSPTAAQPLPQEVRTAATPTPVSQQYSQAAEPAGPYDRGPSHAGGTRDERPQLPKRRAQEHIMPELRDAPLTRTTEDRSEAEHDPGLMAAFQRGVSSADDVSGERPADSSR
jgi:signal transduction histidine kinase